MKVSAFLVVVALAAVIAAAAQTTTPTTTPTTPTQPPTGQAPGTPASQLPPGSQAPTVAPVPPAIAPVTPAVPASRKFTAESGVMFSLIFANKTTDFESVLARVKEALAKSQDPKRKQQALSWRVMKGVEAGPGGHVVYMWLFDPAVKDIEYSITTILSEAFPNEAQDLWAKYTACFASGQSMLNLNQVLSMGPAGTTTIPK